MKVAIVFLAGLCALGLAVPTANPTTPGYHHEFKIADKEWLQKEMKVLQFFKYIQQPSYYKEFVKIADEFHFYDHFDFFTKPEVAKEYYYYYQHNYLLPKGEIFSVFHEQHLKEAIRLFKLFYYAKDFDTFFKTAVWARQFVNEGMFVYTFSLAIIHRPDCYGLILPPIHEIYPYYFFPSEVIHKAQYYKQKYDVTEIKSKTGFKGYTIPSNYSGWYLNLHPEQYMSYFTEDIGINSFYYYYNLFYPFWMDSEEFQIKNPYRGEQFYYFHQQFLARYYLERLSNDFGEIPVFDYDYPISTGYYSSLYYPNGMYFPNRPSNVEVYKPNFDGYQSHSFYSKNFTYSYYFVKDYERRIRDAIDQGFVFTHTGEKVNLFDEHGFETLANLIEANPESPNSYFYGSLQIFARYLLGYSYHPLSHYHIAPSVLEHFETSLRDPVFYQFFKRIVSYFQKYKSYLPAYKYEELYFPGVKVVDVEFDKLFTYFDKFYSDLSNAVYVNEKEFFEDSFHVRAYQERLNFKPFTYKVYVESEKPVDAMVKVFIGPKYDEYGRYFNVSYNRLNFVEFDKFFYQLKAGKNIIERSSYDTWYAQDPVSFYKLFEDVSAAFEGKQEFHVYDYDYYYGFPGRFMLPKGSEDGHKYQFYFVVYPYAPNKEVSTFTQEWFYPVGFQSKFVDNYAYGYPFDRPIYDEFKFEVPNFFHYDVDIYHKDDINVTY